MTNHFVFEADRTAKKIHIVREFNAPIEKVWKAWTEPALLEKWIAPNPWTAETKIMDFTVGGVWLYAMVGPDGQRHWTYAQFTAIEPGAAFSSMGLFCDKEGNPNTEGPRSYRDTAFSSLSNNRSKVDVVITFTDDATIQMFVQGGFEGGTIMTLNQLDALLEE
jgi:uncharacterized protein YndB with AHSA1/START domain